MTWQRQTHENNGAQSPEELETLLEDALLLRDSRALAALFEAGAVLDANHGLGSHETKAVAELALSLWDGEHAYVADLRHLVIARDIALIVTEQAINVACRGNDGSWRYAIVFHLFQSSSSDRSQIESEGVQEP